MNMLIAAGILAIIAAVPATNDNKETKPMLDAKSPEFWKLVPKDAVVEKVADGFHFTEGPLWSKAGFLVFSDIPGDNIVKVTWDKAGKPEVGVHRKVSGNSNGLTYDMQGRLVACEHGNRRVTREEKDGTITVLASHFEAGAEARPLQAGAEARPLQGKRLNSPNDVVVKSDGSIYFTDPPYGCPDPQREIKFQGVFRLSPDGKLTVVADDFDRPNGLTFSPDEKTLYIADSSSRLHIRAFDVKPDGTLANGRVFVKMDIGEPGGPDGMKVDEKGNLWTTGQGGVWVLDPKGKLLGIIRVPELPANCAWGDKDGKTLYMTARTGLYRIRTSAKGVRPWMK